MLSFAYHLRTLSWKLPLALILLSQNARAQSQNQQSPPLDYECGWNYQIQVNVDGRSEDWEQESGETPRVDRLIQGAFQYDWTGPNDASFKLWCRSDENSLYFAILGRDNLITKPKGSAKGDRMELWFENTNKNARENPIMVQIPIWPALEFGRTTVQYGAGRSGAVPQAHAVVAERNEGTGFFMEIELPFEALGGAIGLEPIRFAAVQKDWDHDSRNEKEVAVATANVQKGKLQNFGTLSFERFRMRQIHLQQQLALDERETPKVEQWINIAGDARKEWIAILNRFLIVQSVGTPYFDVAAIDLTDDDNQEPISLQFQNLDGDKDLEILYKYRTTRQHQDQTILQEFTVVADLTPEGIHKVVHQETRYEIQGLGAYVAAMQILGKGANTRLRFGKATGNLSPESFQHIDANSQVSYDPMLMPWDTQDEIVFQHSGSRWRRLQP